MTSQPGRHFKPKDPEQQDFAQKPVTHPVAAREGASSAKPAAEPAAKPAAEPRVSRALAEDEGLPVLAHGDTSVRRVRRRRKKSRGKKVLKVLAVIVVVLGAVVGGTGFYLLSSVKAGEQKVAQAANDKAKDTEDTIEYSGQTYKRNKDIVAIAILGFDSTDSSRSQGRAGQSDTNMVAALNTKTGEIDVVVVPRDSMVTVDQYAGDAYVGQVTQQLCLQFGYGDGGPVSAQRQADAISRVLLNVPIAYYFAIDMTGIAAINDSIGGVEVQALQTIPNSGVVEGQTITLWGDNAYDYLHWRDTSDDTSSLKRQERQAQYLKAFAAKLLSNATAADISSFASLYNTALSYSVTNLGFDEFSYLATKVAGSGVGQIDLRTLTGTMQKGETYMEYYLDESSVEQTVVDTFYTPVEKAATKAETGDTTVE